MLHTKNTAFHILTVMVGTRNTPDEAYRTLYFELEDRKRAWDGSQAQRLRNEAKMKRLEAKIAETTDEIELLELQADLMELKSNWSTMENAILGCEQEMLFIKQIMDELEPKRRYGHLPLGEAFQAAQVEEWAHEWIKRSENFLLTTGTIPTDHFEMMRTHPLWKDVIEPRVEEMRMLQIEGKLALHCLPMSDQKPMFFQDLQKKFSALLPATTEQMSLQLEASKESKTLLALPQPTDHPDTLKLLTAAPEQSEPHEE